MHCILCVYYVLHTYILYVEYLSIYILLIHTCHVHLIELVLSPFVPCHRSIFCMYVLEHYRVQFPSHFFHNCQGVISNHFRDVVAYTQPRISHVLYTQYIHTQVCTPRSWAFNAWRFSDSWVRKVGASTTRNWLSGNQLLDMVKIANPLI